MEKDSGLSKKTVEFEWNDGSGDKVRVTYNRAAFVNSFIKMKESANIDFDVDMNKTGKVRTMDVAIKEDIIVSLKDTMEVVYDNYVSTVFPCRQESEKHGKSHLRIVKK